MSDPSGASPQAASQTLTHVVLTFNRELTDDEVRQMQLQHNAISAVAGGGGHHDHELSRSVRASSTGEGSRQWERAIRVMPDPARFDAIC